MRARGAVALVLAGALGLAAAPSGAAAADRVAATAARDGTQAVADWNRTALATAAVSNGLHEGHNLALVQAAVFDAANSITRRYRPYRVRIRAAGQESVVAAVAAAAHAVLAVRYPEQQAGLDRALADTLAQVPAGRPRPAASPSGRRPRRRCWRCGPASTPTTPSPHHPGRDPGCGSRPHRRSAPAGARLGTDHPLPAALRSPVPPPAAAQADQRPLHPRLRRGQDDRQGRQRHPHPCPDQDGLLLERHRRQAVEPGRPATRGGP
jgi:hypothetical protein